ncbi:MAG TPA: alpha/beta fold hydrolase [Rickettsiales bacterium]|nr:alpha/beta fold hydrolase [Rickettsiales bacterium]
MTNAAIKTAEHNTASREVPPSREPHVCQQPENIMDRLFHAAIGRMTGNLSPVSLAMAGLDWGLHLAFSPEKLIALHKDMLQKTAQLSMYAFNAASGQAVEPVAQPAPGDRRFLDEAWQHLPFNVVQQSFLLYENWWEGVTRDIRGVSPHHLNMVAFAARQMLDIAAPSNNPFTNPEVIRTTVQEGGSNFLRGMAYAWQDLAGAMADLPPEGAEAFEVGKQVAVTPGKVIYRNRLMELIQYEPATKEVYAEPVLIVPAWIMKYYILDLSPNNSLVRYLVNKGHTVFMISWKNPDGRDRDMGMEDYMHQGVEEALKAVRTITGQRIHAVGYCIGGTLLSMTAAALARRGDDSICSITLFAAQTDFEEAGELLLFIDESQVAYLEDVMWQQGYLDKFQMAGAFQMLRSNDLIWSRLVHDYLQGKRQGLNDLMAWNADATRMPYRMHSEYLRHLFLNNDLAEGRYEVDGEPVALKDIQCPVFAVGTVRDHVAPWKSVYKIHLLVDSDVTFVLTSGGHNAGIVSEPGHKGRSYQIATAKDGIHYLPPQEWAEQTKVQEGSWWEAWERWLSEHSSAKKTPPAMGGNSKQYIPLADAPGTYVLVK